MTHFAEQEPIPPVARADVSIACGLALAALIAEGAMALAWHQAGAFAQFDILFESDPSWRFRSMLLGWEDRGYVHPHLANLFSAQIWFAAKIIAFLGGESGWLAERALRIEIGLWLVPFAGAVKLAAIFATMRLLGLGRGVAAAIAILGAVSFSQLLYAAVPDHFAITGTLVALLLLQTVLAVRWATFDRLGLWFLIGGLLTAVSITNVAFLAAALAAARWTRGHRAAAALATGVLAASAILVAVLASGALVGWLVDDWATFGNTGQRIVRYLRTEPAEIGLALLRWLVSLFNAMAAGSVDRIVNNADLAALQGPYPFAYVFEAHRLRFIEIFMAAAMALAMAVGAWRAIRLGGAWRALAIASLAVLAANATMHTLWGDEWILYSQHWHAAQILLLASFAGLFGRFAAPAILLAAGLALWRNAAVLLAIYADLVAFAASGQVGAWN